jgi:ubiquinone/menaquinone biosynthesis C-methylase UbiE
MAPERIYGTARGRVRRVAEPFAVRARVRRVRRFVADMSVTPESRILDVGCGSIGLRALLPAFDITGVDLVDRPGYPGPFVRADATERLPFADGEFDIAYASSVIEHIAPERRSAFAGELRRVARGCYVQTPALSFPIEPHALLPAAHWLPRGVRRRYWRLGAGGDPDAVSLLHRRELEQLFGPAVPERFGPLTKSWICLRPPGGRP